MRECAIQGRVTTANAVAERTGVALSAKVSFKYCKGRAVRQDFDLSHAHLA